MPTAPIPVRLEPGLIARLDAVAKRIGSNRAALIRFCAQTFVEYFERNGGIASLPPNWRELFRSQDGRASAQKIVQIGNFNSQAEQSLDRVAEEDGRYGGKKKGKKK